MNLAFEYIKYRWNAKGRHGTHSPFVYDFVDNCLSIPINKSFKNEISALYTELKSENRKITIQDFGAGSKKLTNHRTLAQIFKNSSSKGKYGKLLYRIASNYKPNHILELGTSLGIGTTHLSKGNPQATIVTVEACEATRNEALNTFNSLKCMNIQSEHATFQSFLKNYEGEPFDLVFVDGHHDGEALKIYLRDLKKFTHNDTLFILDDIRWSNSMFCAWKEIIASEEYNVTMDLFRMGIIVPRKQQVKEHFIVLI